MRSDVAIVGADRTAFGELYEREPLALIEEAFLNVSKNCGIYKEGGVSRKDLEGCFLSTYFLQQTNKIGSPDGFVSEKMGIHVPIQISRSFSSALSCAYDAIKSGKHNLVLVGGVEKMTDRLGKIRDDIMLLEDPSSYYAGATPETNHELMLREYVKKYGIQGEPLQSFNRTLAQIAVKNHRNATKNPKAQYQKEINVDSVLRARGRRYLGTFDFAPVSDGASAVLLASSKVASNYTDKPVYIVGLANATDFLSHQARKDRERFLATRLAMQDALKMAGVGKEQIGLLEVHDQSTFTEMISLEDLGFAEDGKGWTEIRGSLENNKPFYEIGGRPVYVNTNGGLKADGNPFGATGGAQFCEVFQQLRGEAGERQIKELKNGLVQEVEGFGIKADVTILGVE